MEGKRPRVDWGKIETLGREQREAEIFDSGILEEKRFLLSREPALKERIKKLHAIIKELKGRYPKIVSFGLVGSLSKGYASIKKSDIDGFLFIEEKEGSNKKKDSEERKRLSELLKRHLRKKFTLSKEQIHIWMISLSEKKIKYLLQEKTLNSYDKLSYLFTLQAGGRDIEPYRKIILDELEKLEIEHPGEGEKEWKKIMRELLLSERIRFNIPYAKGSWHYTNLYPQTLAEGRKYFLHEII